MQEYQKCLVVGADNVSSTQFQQIRASMRNQAVIIMGKNTMMRKVINGYTSTDPGVGK